MTADFDINEFLDMLRENYQKNIIQKNRNLLEIQKPTSHKTYKNPFEVLFGNLPISTQNSSGTSVIQKTKPEKINFKEKENNLYSKKSIESVLNLLKKNKNTSKKDSKKETSEKIEKNLEVPSPIEKKESNENNEKIFDVNRKYTLIKWKRNNKLLPITYSQIKYSEKEESLVYHLIEPPLNKKLKKIIDKTIDFFEERVDIPLDKLKSQEQVYPYLLQKMKDAWELYGYELNKKEKIIVEYYVFRETSGLGKIEALMHDPNIEDISCDGINLPVYIFHRDPALGEMPTNIIFNKKEELDNYVLKLAQKSGRSLSVANPLMDGSLPDGSRIQITYGTEIARRGSNFTIRKFTKKPLSPIDLLNYGTVSAGMLAYIWFLIEKQKSILISGATAAGKTSFLNALSLFIDPNLKVVSIEDTSELRLPHPNWIPEVSRIGFGPNKYGEVTMYDLLKSSLRQRPDYLIVGEVRGQEASVMFHAMSTGHPSFSTIHADRMETVIDRLTTRPINLPMSLLETLNVIIFLVKSKQKGKFVRRVHEVHEILGYNAKEKNILSEKYAKWKPGTDSFEIKKSKIIERLPEDLGISKKEIEKEIEHKQKIIEWLQKKKISDYRDVAKVIQLYYSEPEEVYKLIKGKNEEK